MLIRDRSEGESPRPRMSEGYPSPQWFAGPAAPASLGAVHGSPARLAACQGERPIRRPFRPRGISADKSMSSARSLIATSPGTTIMPWNNRHAARDGEKYGSDESGFDEADDGGIYYLKVPDS